MEKRNLKNTLKRFINNIEAWQSADVVYCYCSVLDDACEMNYFILYYLLCYVFWNRELWIEPLCHLKEKKYFLLENMSTASFHFPVKFFILLGTV